MSRASIHTSHVAAAALCVGLAAANVARLASPAVALSAPVLVLVTAWLPRTSRLALLVVALLLAGWWWGSVRVAALDESVLVSRVGRADHALVEITTQPREGSFQVRASCASARFPYARTSCSSCRPAACRLKGRGSRSSGS